MTTKMQSDEDIQAITAYARALSTHELWAEIEATMERAFILNNTGTFKIATILLAELETRVPLSPSVLAFRQNLEAAIANTERDASRP
jgi:hypothetical protein